mgnify:FL=1
MSVAQVLVTPAQEGVQITAVAHATRLLWIPACAGMTKRYV